MNKNLRYIMTLIILQILIFGCISNESDTLNDPRIEYGRERLFSALNVIGVSNPENRLNYIIDPTIQKDESFEISIKDSIISISGTDPAGLLYGSLELAEKINDSNKIPESLLISESPQMDLRGVCVLLMKLGTYNYPITPEEFPFFYDKAMWIEYLDFLVQNRFNYIAFWNGHPFSYFVKLDKYPEAQEGMPKGLLEQNNKMLHWLINESKKRNLKLIFEFYNIHTSVYFQKAHNLEDEISIPNELLKEYTSYSIEKFVNEFPDAGLYITAGEALDPKYSVEWVNNTILDAVKRTGEHPQILLRSWFLNYTNAKKILDYYPDIYIERKYNVEMISDTLIDPQNKEWADLTGKYIVNIHMAANLEPFRWNPPSYIQKCVKSSVSVGANGLHLYPRKSWRWPYNCEIDDSSFQWERDKLWFKMWGRYSWNSDRDFNEESQYWEEYFSDHFGSNKAGELALNSFETNADVLPAIQRLFWTGYDNHTVVTSGLMLMQIENAPGIPFLSLDPVQRIPEYLSDLANNRHSSKISPLKFLEEKIYSAEKAHKELESVVKFSKLNMKEAENYLLDSKASELTIKFYHSKLQAAAYYTMYKAGINADINSKKFLKELKKSIDIYSKLTRLTDGHYGSISDVPAFRPVQLKMTPYHWRNILPLYEKEYQVYLEDITEKNKSSNNIPVYKGLLGIIYGDPGLVKPKRILKTSNMEFDWDTNPPDDGRNWSVLFNGFIKAPKDGEVKFYTASKQSVILEIGGKKILKKNSDLIASTVSFKMIKNKWYPFSIEYENVDYKGSNLEVKWSWNDGEIKSIDPEYLKHSKYNLKKANRAIVLGF